MKLEYLFWHARTKRRVPLEELQRLLEEDQRIHERNERRWLAIAYSTMMVIFLVVLIVPCIKGWVHW